MGCQNSCRSLLVRGSLMTRARGHWFLWNWAWLCASFFFALAADAGAALSCAQPMSVDFDALTGRPFSAPWLWRLTAGFAQSIGIDAAIAGMGAAVVCCANAG